MSTVGRPLRGAGYSARRKWADDWWVCSGDAKALLLGPSSGALRSRGRLIIGFCLSYLRRITYHKRRMGNLTANIHVERCNMTRIIEYRIVNDVLLPSWNFICPIIIILDNSSLLETLSYRYLRFLSFIEPRCIKK